MQFEWASGGTGAATGEDDGGEAGSGAGEDGEGLGSGEGEADGDGVGDGDGLLGDDAGLGDEALSAAHRVQSVAVPIMMMRKGNFGAAGWFCG